jgi:hypothetical protein
MGNYNLYVKSPPETGSKAKIIHDQFSMSQGIPNDILGTGIIVTCVKSQNLYKSNPNAKDITITKVLKNGKPEVYFSTNLERVTMPSTASRKI